MLLTYYKLPDQEDFILNLQNNNYSERTVYNYDRDLSIFARFLDHSRVKFTKINKKDLTLYKGYLKRGDHLKVHDRDKELLKATLKRLKVDSDEDGAENIDIKGKNKQTRSKGSKTNEKDSGVPEHMVDALKNADIASKSWDDILGVSGRRSTRSGESGLSSRSINRMLSAVRSYLNWRVDMDLEIPVPPESLKLIKTERKKSQVAELKELVALIEAPSMFEKDIRVSARNRAMMELLFSTGMRISELVGLNMDQINNEGKIFIMGKGKKERFVYLTERAMYHLNEYLKVRNMSLEQVKQKVETESKGVKDPAQATAPADPTEGVGGPTLSTAKFSKGKENALFIPYRGGRDGRRGSRISTNYLQEKIAEYRRRLGIVVPTSAHSLRHGFATYLAENDASPAAIQVLLGHESLQTTTRYVHASDKYAEGEHRQKHPLAK